MKRKLLLAVLALGTVVGYGSALSHRHHHRMHRAEWKAAIADVCVEAAERQWAKTRSQATSSDTQP
jgi:hypothetical protein